MPLQIDLSDRCIIVTGAGSGIGLGIARSLARAGARVAVNDLAEDRAQTGARLVGGGAVALPGDVSNPDQVAAMVDQAQAIMGRLDGLVNNAGRLEGKGSTLSQNMDDWDEILALNLRAPLLMARAVGARLVAQGAGAIVNISSLAGLTPLPASNGYSVSKAGLVMLTKTLAADWGRHGVRVNCVAPGSIDTPMLAATFTAAEGAQDALLRRIPMRRIGRPEEIGEAVAFLMSDLAAYVTGVTLPVDGGLLTRGF